MSVGGNELLTHIEAENPKLGIYLRRYVNTAIENLAQNVGATPNGYVSPPDAPQGLVVNKQGDEQVQFTVQHTSPVQKGIEYFTEVSTSSAFHGPATRTEHHGTSRSPVSTLFLPTKDMDGNNHDYFARSYAQMPGGQPSGFSPIVGPFNMTGITQADHTPSTGSGTAAANGSQPGQGWGNNLLRAAPAAKRTVSG